jgi:hypothetical protein
VVEDLFLNIQVFLSFQIFYETRIAVKPKLFLTVSPFMDDPTPPILQGIHCNAVVRCMSINPSHDSKDDQHV